MPCCCHLSRCGVLRLVELTTAHPTKSSGGTRRHGELAAGPLSRQQAHPGQRQQDGLRTSCNTSSSISYHSLRHTYELPYLVIVMYFSPNTFPTNQIHPCMHVPHFLSLLLYINSCIHSFIQYSCLSKI